MVMAGGSGKRLWPMSVGDEPKQLLPLFEGRTLLDLAADRMSGLVPRSHQLICTAEKHRQAIRSRLRDVDDENILGEPAARNTANAIGLTAVVLHGRDADAVFAVLTADHIISPIDRLHAAINEAFALVEQDHRRMVTFAIEPTRDAIEYGYVKPGEHIATFDRAYVVDAFEEKPPTEADAAALRAQGYRWNSGMFVFSARGYLDALQQFIPESANGVSEIAAAWKSDDRTAVLNRVYPDLPDKQVDKAILEEAPKTDAFDVCTILISLNQWIDVGSWTSFGDTLDADDDGNRSNTRTMHVDSSNVLTVSNDPNHLIATIGCENLVVVRTDYATLICPADQAQRVKELAESVNG